MEDTTGTKKVTDSTTPTIVIECVDFSYDGYKVLENVNLTIFDRDFVTIVGPNGGGKTTLLKIILGLLHPTKGTVRVFGMPPEQARTRIGYMPQHVGLDLSFPATVMDVVLMGRLGPGNSFGRYSKDDKRAAEEALKELGLYGLRSKPFSAISGGQRQRLLIARALACEPDLLLLDEPTANLDMAIESELYELLSHLNRSLTIVLVSHDLGFVSKFVKTVVCVKRKVLVHPATEITGEAINEIYGSPMKMVRHDHNVGRGIDKCFSS